MTSKTCPECSFEMSNLSPACPNCGVIFAQEGHGAETPPGLVKAGDSGGKRHLHILGAAIMTAVGVFWLLAALEPRVIAIVLMFGGVAWLFGSRIVYRKRDRNRR